MKAIKIIFLNCIIYLYITSPSLVMSTELGFGYGKEFRDNSNIEQYEVYVREPLPFKWEFDHDFKILSAVEVGMAMITEAQSTNDEPARISVMPQLIFSPNRNVSFIFGFGAGFMIGNTKFTNHNLGGAMLFDSKIGLQFMLGQHWNFGYFYFHQSNAGIYDYNAGLNMHQLALSYTF
ncbi:MAG: acyloxyacyl hydrolase [Proteobacteria bacterium]|nr:acyloxyacyl hydrolase [Pseudomonadota bacterium]